MKKVFGVFILVVFVSVLCAKDLQNHFSNLISSPSGDSIVVSLKEDILNDLENISFLHIHLSSNKIIKFSRIKSKRNLNGSVSWVGENKSEDSTLLLTYFNGILMGKIRNGLDVYGIFANQNNTYNISKEGPLKQRKFKEHMNLDHQDSDLYQNSLMDGGGDSGSSPDFDDFDLNITDGKLQLNVMILYTQNFSNYYGAGAQTRIQYLIDLANNVFSNSQIDIELNLVHSELFNNSSTSELNDINTALDGFRSNSKVRQLKRKYKAHFASLFRIYNGGGMACGLGRVATGINYIDFNHPFTVVENKQYNCSDLTFIHEVGHNFGCKHDRDNSSGTPIFNYAYGYDQQGVFATVMSYKSPEIPYFSNPDITYEGHTIGVSEGNPNAANNTKTINQTKYYIADQYNEKLELTDDIKGKRLKGVLSDGRDSDSFDLILNGEINFDNIFGFYLNIYDLDGNLLIVSDSNSFTYNFPNGKYYVVVSARSHESSFYYSVDNKEYDVVVEGDMQRATPPLDSDNDGITDKDELRYGLDPYDGTDAKKDKDGDSVSNIDEIILETDPTDASSNKRLESSDKLLNKHLQGIIINTDDDDAFKVVLDGNVEFKDIDAFYLNIYNSDGELVVSNGGYVNLSHNFQNGIYYVVVSPSNPDNSSHYILENYNYDVLVEGNISEPPRDSMDMTPIFLLLL
ncbi:MAG: hypothetical protein CR967_01895 [Proteobacteria bacterium]|nr:MAG: hypothetical protein CR967_01895 [Pseudomonadota bacterium]